MNRMTAARPTWHFWAIAAASLLWNGFGAFDYTMTQIRHPAIIQSIPPHVLQVIDAAPLWATSAWAIGVWASLLGAVLLLLRSRHAAAAFGVSLIAALASFGWQFGAGIVDNPVLPAVIVAAIAVFWWYARRATGQGLLR